jgi:hypothetical protein
MRLLRPPKGSGGLAMTYFSIFYELIKIEHFSKVSNREDKIF